MNKQETTIDVPLKVFISEGAHMPERAYQTDAGADLRTPIDITLLPGQRQKISIGIIFEIPDGYVGLVQAKSGLAATYGITTIGNVIDSSYRGFVHTILVNTGNQPVHIGAGDKVAQILFVPCTSFEFERVDSADKMSKTDRNISGFGSSGT